MVLASESLPDECPLLQLGCCKPLPSKRSKVLLAVLLEVLGTVRAHCCEIDGRARGHAVWGAGAGAVARYLGLCWCSMFLGFMENNCCPKVSSNRLHLHQDQPCQLVSVLHTSQLAQKSGLFVFHWHALPKKA